MVVAKLGKKRTPDIVARCRKGRIYTPLSAEHKAQISRANTGRVWSYESIQKRKETIKNDPKFSSPEFKKKLSDRSHLSKHKRLRTYMENKFNGKLKVHGKKIIDVDTGDIFYSASDVAKLFNRTRAAVSYAILHKQRTCGGKRLFYLANIGTDATTMNVEIIRKEFKEYIDGNKIILNSVKSDDLTIPTIRGFYNGKNVRNSSLSLIVKLLHKLKLDKQV